MWRADTDWRRNVQIFIYSNELAERGKRKMEKKNVVFTKDGARVGVKEVRAEDYADRTQRFVAMRKNLGKVKINGALKGFCKDMERCAR